MNKPAKAPTRPPASGNIAMTPPSAPSAASARALARAALEHASAGAHVLARRAADNAMRAIEHVEQPELGQERAHAALMTGEALLLLYEAHRASTCFEIAARSFDREGDLLHAAKARHGLAKALLAVDDPSARAILEDAGELYEEIGDDRAMLAIDLALRQAQAAFEESPRSFHAPARLG